MNGLLRIANGVSPSVDSLSVAISLVGFTVIYGVLAVADVYLLSKHGLGTGTAEEVTSEAAISLAY